MIAKPFTPEQLVDGLFSFEAGVNAGIAPLLLPRNTLSSALNTTVRGSFATHRPPYYKIEIEEDGLDLLNDALSEGPFQGSCYFNQDNGDQSLVVQIAGRLFEITPGEITDVATVTEWTISGDPNPSTDLQVWMWQAEKWVIVQNGTKNPIFFDGVTARRSNFTTQVAFSTSTTSVLTIPAVGQQGTVDFTSVADLVVDDIVTIQNRGTFQVLSIAGNTVTYVNLTMTPFGLTVAASTPTDIASWQHLGTELPPGRMGTYGLGRNWMSLPDGKQFIASDIVGGSSGTVAENYRDAVLNVTENLYLAGGGNFAVPGSIGDIRAMRFTATLDVSLGQGPLQILTPNAIFSCSAPVDRLTWQDVTNPILTQSLISNGGLSQYGTVVANGDLIFRSIDGIRSLILARREFNTWGNVPISEEVEPRMVRDSEDLLGYSSAIVFDNRLLMTTSPVLSDYGVYWRALVPLNFDPLSSLRGKEPSVYDSLEWSGLNIFQLATGLFSNVERAFAFGLNTNDNTFELYELRKSPPTTGDTVLEPIQFYDNADTRIVWAIASSTIDFGERDPRTRRLKRLINGEFYIDSMSPDTRVDYQAWYKPDQWPCWIPWFRGYVCADAGRNQYRSRIGLGEPSPTACDQNNNKPQREGYSFQIKFIFEGHCRFLGAKFKSVTVPEPKFAPTCCALPLTGFNLGNRNGSDGEEVAVILDTTGAAVLDTTGAGIIQA